MIDDYSKRGPFHTLFFTTGSLVRRYTVSRFRELRSLYPKKKKITSTTGGRESTVSYVYLPLLKSENNLIDDRNILSSLSLRRGTNPRWFSQSPKVVSSEGLLTQTLGLFVSDGRLRMDHSSAIQSTGVVESKRRRVLSHLEKTDLI